MPEGARTRRQKAGARAKVFKESTATAESWDIQREIARRAGEEKPKARETWKENVFKERFVKLLEKTLKAIGSGTSTRWRSRISMMR